MLNSLVTVHSSRAKPCATRWLRRCVGSLVLLSIAATSGCGFHLKGHGEGASAAHKIFLNGPAWLADELQILLESAGGGILASHQGADASVRVREEGFDKRVISVDAQTGKEREFELVYSVYFDASDANRSKVLENERVSVLRDYTLDADAVIGKGREEGVLREEMRRDAAAQLLRRVESVLWR